MNNCKTVRIFTMPQQFPCGTDSSCCGPVGLSEEEIQLLKNTIEKEMGCQVEMVDAMKGDEMKSHLEIVRLLRSFGPTALPIIAFDSDIVSMGTSDPEQVISAITSRIVSDAV